MNSDKSAPMMARQSVALWVFLCLMTAITGFTGCGGSSSGTGGGGGGTQPPPTVNNQQPVQVNPGPEGDSTNQLYTSVTVCVPGTSNCQTIQDVQVDTGSEGLRILASALTLSLPAIDDASGNPLGNCVDFADGSFLWGSVVTADVQMAGEKASGVPIQVIGDPNFPSVPSLCSDNDNDAGVNDQGKDSDYDINDGTLSALGANGIIGLGVFRQDCGPACSGPASQAPDVYFGCGGSGCSVASVPLQNQLQNPVWLFPQDNNGLLITLPSVTAAGSPTVSGTMIFGIGTQSDNALGQAQVYTTDDLGDFTTTYQGQPYSSSFIDSGSNGIFFLSPSTIALPACGKNAPGFSCPPSPVQFNATNTGQNGTSGQVSFSVANAENLFQSANSAFANLGGPDTGNFDWGLPFFFGQTVFIGIEGQSSPAGIGPYWAY